MALIRPVVLVFQEIATPTVTPSTPDLNCLVVGPAYWIQDYFAPGTTTNADKADIRVSDYGVLEGSPAVATPVGSAVITIAEPPNNKPGALLDSASVVVFFDEARAIVNTAGTGVTSASTPNTFTATGTAWNTVGSGQVKPGDRVIVKDGTTNVIARTVLAVDSDTSLRFTADLPPSGFTPGSGQTYRIERQVNDVQVDPSFLTVNGNVVKINGSVTVPVTGQGSKTVSFAKVFLQYRALRQDLVDLDTVESKDAITTKIGRLDARNPLGAAAFVALQNTTTVVQFLGVLSDDLPGHVQAKDHITARPDVYAIIPLTTSVSVFAMWNADCLGLSAPDEDTGRPQRFRVVIGNGTLPITKLLVSPSVTGQSVQASATAPAGIVKIVLTGVASLVTGGVIPGDKLIVTVTSVAGTVAVGTYVIASVTDASTLEVDVANPFAGAGTCNVTASITQADGVSVRIASAALTGVVTSAGDDLFLILKDNSGTFVSSGVAAGDLVRIPVNPNAAITSTSVFTTVVVAAVLSENRLQVVNAGADASGVINELPHGVKRGGGALVTTTTISYQIVRTLSKDQQVLELVALSQSFRSKRTILVWPDKCDVAGVTGGGKQPGWYLAAAVGGMTAGLPSQHGFTNLGIAGVSQIFDSNTYFTDRQLTDISNGGWFVFAQATTTSLPFSIHQLTTDTTTLESGEYSVVKNFDFVALFFVDILQVFLGVYNVTQDTLTYLQAALNTGGDVLKLRSVAKIGAPLTSFQINDLGVSPTAGDRVVTHLGIGLPKPLNVIELHLVA
jgi:hypothetical protein